ncbi:hypothetical protein INT45_007208 [Circinella minor]|uniref:Uncharacterized protein n=1 Tax=Circinella minor TaxID=1195481 RepID=A0A8H7RU24_9FUNG|nr:hypothetical protein INT45_007208 [Circinella minor]
MRKLWSTISEQLGSIITGASAVSAAVYATERNISENKKNQTNINEEINKLRKLIEEQRHESKEKDKKIEEILNNLDQYQKMANEAFKNKNLESQTELENNTLDSLNIKKASLFDLESLHTNESVNYPFYASFSTGFMLFSFATLSALMGLITNYYTKLYGDQYINKAPKWLLPIINNYFKLVKISPSAAPSGSTSVTFGFINWKPELKNNKDKVTIEIYDQSNHLVSNFPSKRLASKELGLGLTTINLYLNKNFMVYFDSTELPTITDVDLFNLPKNKLVALLLDKVKVFGIYNNAPEAAKLLDNKK